MVSIVHPSWLVIMFNEEIFPVQEDDPPPSVPTKRDIIYSSPSNFLHQTALTNQIPEGPPGDKKVFAPFKVVQTGRGAVIVSLTP